MIEKEHAISILKAMRTNWDEDSKSPNAHALDMAIKALEQEYINRPTKLYAIEECISGNIIFNARGGCYKEYADAMSKVARLIEEDGKSYRIVKYELTFD